MAYEFRILASDTDHQLRLAEEVRRAVEQDGRWEKSVEVRMAAGPTVQIQAVPGGEESFRVDVRWGSQTAATEVFDLAGAVEAADRLAYAFYEMRLDGPRQRR